MSKLTEKLTLSREELKVVEPEAKNTAAAILKRRKYYADKMKEDEKQLRLEFTVNTLPKLKRAGFKGLTKFDINPVLLKELERQSPRRGWGFSEAADLDFSGVRNLDEVLDTIRQKLEGED